MTATSMNPTVRGLVLLGGIVCSAIAVVIRYWPETITARNRELSFQVFSGQPWLVVPIWFVFACFLTLLALIPVATGKGRQMVRTLTARRHRRPALLIAALLFLLTLVPAAYSRGRDTDSSIAVYLIFGTLGVIGLLVGGVPGRNSLKSLSRVSDWFFALRPLWAVLIATGFVFLVSNLISALAYGHVPRIHDNVAQLFQARLFAHGRLFAPSPPLPQFYDLMMMINDGRWYSQYPPGHPLVLALGVLIGMPWIVNPLLGTFTVGIIYLLGRELYDEPTARLGMFLASLSPFLLLMSSQFMNHASSLFFTALFLLGYVRTIRVRPGLLTPFLTGLALGMVLLVRPYTALLVALPLVLDALMRVMRTRGRAVTGFLPLALGTGLVFLAFLGYNYLTCGNPFEIGYVTRYGPYHGLGIGRSGWGAAHTWSKAFAATGLDLNAINRYLFEFPIPSLFFIALLFAGRAGRSDYLLLMLFASLVIGHFFYWWHDLLFGPRWEYEALPALVLLTARGIRTTPDFLRQGLGLSWTPEQVRAGTGRLLTLCYLSLAAVALPSLIRQIPGTFGIRTETRQAVARTVRKPALVFTPRLGDVFLENRVPPGGDLVFANDLGALNPLLREEFPEHNTYYAQLDTVRELLVPKFEQSQLEAALDTTVARISNLDLRNYRSIFWPSAELEYLVAPLAQRYGLKVISYRALDRIAVGKKNLQSISFPALAAWVRGDRSEHVVIFGEMNQLQSRPVGGLQMNYLGITRDSLIALFSIYPLR